MSEASDKAGWLNVWTLRSRLVEGEPRPKSIEGDGLKLDRATACAVVGEVRDGDKRGKGVMLFVRSQPIGDFIVQLHPAETLALIKQLAAAAAEVMDWQDAQG